MDPKPSSMDRSQAKRNKSGGLIPDKSIRMSTNEYVKVKIPNTKRKVSTEISGNVNDGRSKSNEY